MATAVDATTWAEAVDHSFFIIYDLAMGGGFPTGVSGVTTPTTATRRNTERAASRGCLCVAQNIEARELCSDSHCHESRLMPAKFKNSEATAAEPEPDDDLAVPE